MILETNALSAFAKGDPEGVRQINDTTKHYAQIRSELKKAARPIPANDAWIAALARQHALPILSRDLHFDFVKGLRRVTW